MVNGPSATKCNGITFFFFIFLCHHREQAQFERELKEFYADISKIEDKQNKILEMVSVTWLVQ